MDSLFGFPLLVLAALAIQPRLTRWAQARAHRDPEAGEPSGAHLPRLRTGSRAGAGAVAAHRAAG
ncbi:hypothetical protein GCM10027440_13470 [Nocardiopsis coralliicola]